MLSFSVSAFAADFTVNFTPADSSVGSTQVSSMLSSKISDFAAAVVAAMSAVYKYPSQTICYKSGCVGTYTSSTASGTYVVPAGVKYLKIRMVGGGAGGGGSTAGAWAPISGSGTASSFGSSLLTAGGGTGGSVNAGAPGAPVIGTNAKLFYTFGQNGGIGGGGNNKANTNDFSSGYGAAAPQLGAQGGSCIGAQNGLPGGFGSGGGGGCAASGTAATLGPGGSSGAYVEGVIQNPDASYPYSVGSGGAAGTGSVSYGGAGGDGIIFIEERY